jgi:hypothetical protein
MVKKIILKLTSLRSHIYLLYKWFKFVPCFNFCTLSKWEKILSGSKEKVAYDQSTGNADNIKPSQEGT